MLSNLPISFTRSTKVRMKNSKLSTTPLINKSKDGSTLKHWSPHRWIYQSRNKISSHDDKRFAKQIVEIIARP